MKILMLTPYLPFPLVSGGQIRTYNLLKNLSKKHEITLASFIRDRSETKYLDELKPYCQKVIVFKRRKAWSPLNIILAGFSLYPFLVSIYYGFSVKRKVKAELDRENYDLIHAETFYVMPNIPKTNVPILLVEQVIEYLVYQRFVQNSPAWAFFVKPLLIVDVLKIKLWERYYWKKAKRLATMSQEDKDFILKTNPNLKVNVVANGVDVVFFKQTKRKKTKNPTVLFVGNFKWLPNRDAAKYLIKEIWPQIKENFNDARLWIVGRNPPEDITPSARDRINVSANIEDIRTAYGNCDVLLAPVRNGRGTKYKILEAMATKTPIVGTQIAIEGINVKDGREAYVGKNATELAQKTVQILNNPKIGQELAKNAYELVSRDYNWEKISQALDEVYLEVGAK